MFAAIAWILISKRLRQPAGRRECSRAHCRKLACWKRNQGGTERRGGQRKPAADMQAFPGEQNGCDGEKHGKRADHQGSMGDGSEGESLELEEVLHWHSQHGRGKQWRSYLH
jgi:hypothetical protein